MEAQNFIFNGKRFRYPQDFEQEFKPTKWSIRKFINFMDDFELSEKHTFATHTIYILGNFHTADKDTQNFIKQIRDKRKNNFGINGGYDFFKHSPVMTKENQEQLIKAMAELKAKGVIQKTAPDIAEILKNNFGVNLSLLTIKRKIYDFTKKINEKI